MLEREHELAEIDALLSAAVAGTGRLLVIAGEAGIGKSTLLRAAAARAAERGLRVLTASGGALETEFAFGVARQLFGDAGDLRGAAAAAAPALGLRAVGTRVLDAGQRAVSFELQHGLYWLTADLAESSPLLVCVDDVQWADPDSLGFLAYLARRLDDLPVALLVAVREGEPCPAPEVLAALRAGGRELTPAALSEAAVRRLGRRRRARCRVPPGERRHARKAGSAAFSFAMMSSHRMPSIYSNWLLFPVSVRSASAPSGSCAPYLGRASSGWIAPASLAHVFDHFIGNGKQCRRHGKAERLRGLQVDRDLVFCRRLHRQVGRLLALEDAVEVAGRAPELVNRIRAARAPARGWRGAMRRQRLLRRRPA